LKNRRKKNWSRKKITKRRRRKIKEEEIKNFKFHVLKGPWKNVCVGRASGSEEDKKTL